MLQRAFSYDFHPALSHTWLQGVVLAERNRLPTVWVNYHRLDFKVGSIAAILASLEKHFPDGAILFIEPKMRGEICLEPPRVVIAHDLYRLSLSPAYTDEHGVDWRGILTLEVTPKSRKHRKADIKIAMRADAQGRLCRPSLEVTPALDRELLDNPSDDKLPLLEQLGELIAGVKNNQAYLQMLEHFRGVLDGIYHEADEKPQGWKRLNVLLNKTELS